MKVSYDYTEKDLKKFLIKSRLVNNIVLFIICLSIYLIFTIKTISLVFLPIAIVVLLVLLYLLNKLYAMAYVKVNYMLNYNLCGKYTIELTPNKFSVTVNSKKVDYKYKQIKKIKENKNTFKLVFQKRKDSLIFEKKFFNPSDYEKMMTMFKEKIEQNK